MEQHLTTRTAATPARCRPPRAAGQQGMVLFIALIVLVAMTLAGLALVRSVDTANVIAGNLAFRQATLQAGDLGVEAAINPALPTLIAAGVDTDQTPGPTYWYYASRRKTDANGIPMQEYFGAAGVATAIDWSNVPVASNVAGNEVKIVIDRLCQGPVPPAVIDPLSRCFADVPGGTGSKKAGSFSFAALPIVYYRVTARVAGPRNTVSMVQAILSR